MGNVKKISIFYLHNGDLQNEIRAIKLMNTLKKELQDEGRNIRVVTKFTVSFEDGSSINVSKFNTNLRAMRSTKVFVDESITSLNNGMKLVNDVIKPIIIINNSEKYSIEQEPIVSYSYVGDKLELNKID